MVGAGVAAYNVLSLSITQTICPPELLGRAFSVIRLIVLGASAIGSTLAGLLGTWLGTRLALLLIMAGLLVIPLALVLGKALRGDFTEPSIDQTP